MPYGQLVLYPILDLQALNPDLHWYLRQLEQVGYQHNLTHRHQSADLGTVRHSKHQYHALLWHLRRPEPEATQLVVHIQASTTSTAAQLTDPADYHGLNPYGTRPQPTLC